MVRRFLKGVDGLHRERIKNAVNWTRIQPAIPQGPLSAFDRHSFVGFVQKSVQPSNRPFVLLCRELGRSTTQERHQCDYEALSRRFHMFAPFTVADRTEQEPRCSPLEFYPDPAIAPTEPRACLRTAIISNTTCRSCRD